MAHKIELQAVMDAKQITRSVKELSSTIDATFKDRGVELFDLESMKFLKSEAKTAVTALTSSMQSLKKEAAEIDRQLKEGNKSEAEKNKLVKQRLVLTKEMATTEKSITNLNRQQRAAFPEKAKAMEAVTSGDQPLKNVTPANKLATLSQGMGEAITTVAGSTRSPIASGALRVGSSALGGAQAAKAGGMGLAGGAALGGIAAVAGAAAVAIGRMSAAADVFTETVPQQLTLEAVDRGINRGGLDAGAGLGYDPSQVADIQLDLARSMGAAPTAQAGANRLEQTMLSARTLGVSAQEITQGAGQLRQTTGTAGAQRDMAKILDKAITSGMDKSQATFFLSTATGLLTDLNKTGVANSDKLLAAMAEMVAAGTMSPEMAAKTLTSVNESIAGSTGEANLFFQTAATRGMPGGTGNIFGAQAMVAQGLTGLNREDAQRMLGGTETGEKSLKFFEEAGLMSQTFSQDFARSILGDLNNRFDTTTTTGQAAQLDFTGQMFGTKNPVESAKILATLERIGEGMGTEEDVKVLQDFGKDPQQAWRDQVRDQLSTIAGNTRVLQASGKKVQFDLGEKALEKIFNPLKEAVISMDRAILSMNLVEPIGKLTETVTDLSKSVTDFIEAIRNSAIGKALGMEQTDAEARKAAATSLQVAQKEAEFSGGLTPEQAKRMTAPTGDQAVDAKNMMQFFRMIDQKEARGEDTSALLDAVREQTEEIQKQGRDKRPPRTRRARP